MFCFAQGLTKIALSPRNKFKSPPKDVSKKVLEEKNLKKTRPSHALMVFFHVLDSFVFSLRVLALEARTLMDVHGLLSKIFLENIRKFLGCSFWKPRLLTDFLYPPNLFCFVFPFVSRQRRRVEDVDEA